MNRPLILGVCLLVCAEASHAAAANDALTMTAQLVSPISSRSNKKGDRVSAIVLSPAAFRGAPLEGDIDIADSSGNVEKTSSLRFAFKQLTYNGRAVPVNVDILGFRNSKGQAGVDEEGRVVRKSSGVGKALAAAGIGAAIGALLDGRKGAAIGAGAGLAAGFLFVSIAVKGPDIALDPNSVFELAVRECEDCPADQIGLAQRQFSNGVFSFYYPSNWQTYWDGRSAEMTAAPAFGVVGRRGNTVEIGYGVVAGLYTPSRGGQLLQNATDELIRSMRSRSPDLQVVTPDTPTPAGSQLLVIPMVRPSALEAGNEVRLLITTMSPYGLFYLTGIAPGSRSQEISEFSRPILQTLRFRE